MLDFSSFTHFEEDLDMIGKRICLFFAVFGVLTTYSSVLALNSADVESVRAAKLASKARLSVGDKGTIETFVRLGLQELLLEADPWQAVTIRVAILAQKGGSELSPYSAAFVEAAVKNIETTFEDAGRLQDADRRQRMFLHLLIIAAELESTEMADIGLGMLSGPGAAVQYWAVKTVTSPAVAAELTSPLMGDEDLTRRIVGELAKTVDSVIVPEALRMVVEFADAVDTAEARALVLKIADMRTVLYERWTVKYELMDTMLLSALGKQILSENAEAKRVIACRKFGQLYSYVIERFILGQEVLSTGQKRQLASVIAEVENTILSKLLARSQVRLRKAVESAKVSVLESERKFILGGPGQAGSLSTKLKFDYGKESTGNATTAPKSLKAPPVPPGTTGP